MITDITDTLSYCESCGGGSEYELAITEGEQKYLSRLEISIDFQAFSCLREKLSCLSWLLYFHIFGVI